jgi:hypothetical protein
VTVRDGPNESVVGTDAVKPSLPGHSWRNDRRANSSTRSEDLPRSFRKAPKAGLPLSRPLAGPADSDDQASPWPAAPQQSHATESDAPRRGGQGHQLHGSHLPERVRCSMSAWLDPVFAVRLAGC